MSDVTPALTQRAERTPARAVLLLSALVAVSLSLFQLVTAGVIPVGLFYQRSIHLALILVLAFLLYPVFGRARRRGPLGWAIDGALIAGSVLSGFYLSYNLEAIFSRAGFWTQTDVTVGIITVVTLLEASRRVIGFPITLIGITFIVYAMAGSRGELPFLADLLPGILAHRGYTLERIVSTLYLGQGGIYGTPLGVAATFVFIFILFGAFLEVTGGGKFFIDLAYAAAGRQRGGPAKAAVIASAFMGSISGSSIANVVTTGAFTIPLMKRLGYKPEEAGGIEAAASTGGQIMPPIMGAGAFLIAEYTGLPYAEIVKLSILPALMYFSTVYLFVDIIAAKRGMTGMARSELPRMRQVLLGGWHFLLPLGLLVYFLVRNFSPNRVGFVAVVSIIVVAVLRALVGLASRRFLGRPQPSGTVPSVSQIDAPLEQASPPTPDTLVAAGLSGVQKFFTALEVGAKNAIPVSVACALAGIVVGIISLTGLGLKFSSLMLTFSGGNLVLAILLVALASLVLGLGLPVTASYIVLAVLTAPALQSEFGVPIVIAHLLIFWYSQDSNVTPPVALAAFAAAGIAGSDPMRTGFFAWKFAKGLYLIPLFMVFNPEIILGGTPQAVAWNVVTAFAALAAFAAALEGFLFSYLNVPLRLLATAGTVAIFWPNIYIEAAGLAAIVLVIGSNYLKARREGRFARTEPAPSGA